jgi:hypothetical protein
MTDKPPKDYGTNKFTQQQPRSYIIGSSFGPLAKNLDKIEVTKLAEIERGGPDDWRPGRR